MLENKGDKMDENHNRRGFLISAGYGAGLLAMLSPALLGQEKHAHKKMMGMDKKMMGMDPLKDRFPRKDPSRELSPPSKMMGKQMGRVNTLGSPALGYSLDGKVKVFHLTAQPVEVTITEGSKGTEELIIPEKWQRYKARPSVEKKCMAWGYNGITPGPTIEATEGERVRIIFKNELPEPTSIHWHGFELPFTEDGAAGYHPFEARRPVLPGETTTYEFDLIQSGTLMYHTGFNVMKQEGMGLGGLFVVHPKKEEKKIDHDFAILMQQWTFVPGNPNPDVNAMEPSFATFNGKTAPDIPMMVVKQGDRVRIRLANLSLLYHPIHIHGHVFEIVGTTGGPIQKSARLKDVTVSVGPGESRDIEFVAWNPGTWRMHCHVLHHLMNQMPNMPMGIAPAEGMFTHLKVIPKVEGYDPRDPKSPWEYPAKDKRI